MPHYEEALEIRPFQQVGVRRFDEEHAKLNAYLNQARKLLSTGASSEAIWSLLSKIYFYMSQHFSEEETLMMECGYPDFSRHMMQHRKMLERLRLLMDKYKANEDTSAADIVLFIVDWLHEHLAASDAKYSDCLRANGIE